MNLILENGATLEVTTPTTAAIRAVLMEKMLNEEGTTRILSNFQRFRENGKPGVKGTVYRDGKAIPMNITFSWEGRGMHKVTHASVTIGERTYPDVRIHRHGKEVDQYLRRFTN